ncbi:hypothetical protein BC833DRAFT_618315 [Globomyces pollinis-pini]|nr:hypothetical protein BC833DRAFT_618315 [Globomyces pollinis-pini]
MKKSKDRSNLKSNTNSLQDISTISSTLNESFISAEGMLTMFTNELKYCLKSFQSNCNTNTNVQLRWIVNKFLGCLAKFDGFMNEEIFLMKCVETGELLLEIKGFHQIALEHCFNFVNERLNQRPNSVKVTEKLPNNETEKEELSFRVFFGQIVAEYLLIVDYDYGLKHPNSMTRIKTLTNLLQETVDDLQNNERLNWVVLHCVYHIYHIASDLTEKGSTNEAILLLEWISNLIQSHPLKFKLKLVLKIHLSLYNWLTLTNNTTKAESMLRKALEIYELCTDNEVAEQTSAIHTLRLILSSLKLKQIPLIKLEENVKPTTQTPSESFPNHSLLYYPVILDFQWSSEYLGYLWTNTISKTQSIHTYNVHQKFLSTDLELFNSELAALNAKVPAIQNAKLKSLDEFLEEKSEGIIIENENSKKEKKKVVKENSDEQRIEHILSGVESPSNKLSLLVHTLSTMIGIENRIKYFEKSDDPQKESFLLTLLDYSFNIFISVYQSKFSKEKKQHFESDKSHTYNIPLDANDILQLSQFFFQTKQWNRFNCTIEFIQLMKETAVIKPQQFIDSQLRLAVAYFYQCQQNDKKVVFESNLHGKATPTDVRVSRFDVSDSITASAIVVCQGIANYIITRPQSKLLIDAINVIWNFLDPFFKELKSTKDSAYYCNLSEDDLVFQLFKFLHSCYSTIGYYHDIQDIIQGVMISRKLALLYECQESYEMGKTIMLQCLKNVERARVVNIGTCGSQTSTLVADESYNPNFQFDEAIQCELFAKYRREFSCIHVDVLASYYRCLIKHLQKVGIEETKQIELKTFKLKHIHLNLKPDLKLSEEVTLKEHCGDDPLKRAIFILAIIMNVEGLTSKKKQNLLKLASQLLHRSRETENSLVKGFEERQNSNLELIVTCRTSTSITVRISPGETDAKAFQIYCNSSGSLLGKNGIDFPGTGTMHQLKNDGVKVYGLNPNIKYDFCFVLYSDAKSQIPIGQSSRLSVIATLPLSIPLVWTYFSEISHFLNDNDMLYMALNTLEQHFIINKTDQEEFRRVATSSYYGLDHSPVFTLNHTALVMAHPSIIRGFIQSQFAYIDTTTKTAVHGMIHGDILSSQLLRLKFCQHLLICIDCLDYAEIPRLAMLCVIKIHQQLQPFLYNDINNPFIVHTLLKCHKILLERSNAFDNDRSKGLREILVPISYHLVRALIAFGNIALAAQVSFDAVSLITISTYSADNKIVNSNTIETTNLGYVYKPHKGKSKRGSTNYLLEFGYHGKLAVIKPAKTGLPFNRKQFDIFYEHMEVLMAKYKAIAPSQLDNPQAKKMTIMRKVLDGITSLKEIYLLYTVAGPETTVQELSKFRKNPRYVELIYHIVTWCIEKESIEIAIRLSVELEDWIDKRTQILIRMDELQDDVMHHRKEIVIKRRRRQLFATDKTALFDAIKTKQSGEISRGRTTEPVENVQQVKDNEPDAKKKVKVTTPDASRPSSRATSSGSGSHSSRSRNSSRDRSAPGSPKKGSSRSNSIVDNPLIFNTEQVVVETEVTTAQMAKRKRAAFRHNFFLGMSNTEKDKYDQAIRILDTNLHYLWHRRCYTRRIRALLEFENPWRSSLLYQRGKAVLVQIKRDMKKASSNLNEIKDQYDCEWFEFRKCGAFFFNGGSMKENEKLSDVGQMQNNQIIDMIQAFVQSITIASRSGDHLKVIKYSRTLWDSLRYLYRNGKLDTEFWRLYLWRGMLVVSYAILDTIKTCHIHRQYKDNVFLDMSGMRNNAKKNESTTQFNINDLYEGQFIITWIDSQQAHQAHPISMSFCSEFVLFTIELIYVAGKYHRLLQFIKRVQSAFHRAHDIILAPLAANVASQIQNNITGFQSVPLDTVPQISQSPIQLRYLCRYLVSKMLHQTIIEGVSASENSETYSKIRNLYEIAIEKTGQTDKDNIHPSLCIEYADILYEMNNFSAATVFWSNAIDSILKSPNSVKNWRTILFKDGTNSQNHKECARLVSIAGSPFKALQLAMTFAKLGRFVFHENFDRREEMIWLSSQFFFAYITSDILNPKNALDYANFIPNSLITGQQDIFADKYQFNPSSLYETLIFIATEMHLSGYSASSIPLLAFAEAIAVNHLASMQAIGTIWLLKCEYLVYVGLVNEALASFQEYMRRSSLKKRNDELNVDLAFDNLNNPLSSAQFQVLKQFMFLTMSDKNKLLYQPKFLIEMELSRMKMILRILDIGDISETSAFIDQSKQQDQMKPFEWQDDILNNMRTTLSKLIAQIQQLVLKNEPVVTQNRYLRLLHEETTAHQNIMLAESFTILAKSFYLQRRYRPCVKWLMSLKAYYTAAKKQGQHLPITTKFTLNNADLMVNCFVSEHLNKKAAKICQVLQSDWRKNSRIIEFQLKILQFEALNLMDKEEDPPSTMKLQSELEQLYMLLKNHPMCQTLIIKYRLTLFNYFFVNNEYLSALENYKYYSSALGSWKENNCLSSKLSSYTDFELRALYICTKHYVSRLMVVDHNNHEEVVRLCQELWEWSQSPKLKQRRDTSTKIDIYLGLCLFHVRQDAKDYPESLATIVSTCKSFLNQILSNRLPALSATAFFQILILCVNNLVTLYAEGFEVMQHSVTEQLLYKSVMMTYNKVKQQFSEKTLNLTTSDIPYLLSTDLDGFKFGGKEKVVPKLGNDELNILEVDEPTITDRLKPTVTVTSGDLLNYQTYLVNQIQSSFTKGTYYELTTSLGRLVKLKSFLFDKLEPHTDAPAVKLSKYVMFCWSANALYNPKNDIPENIVNLCVSKENLFMSPEDAMKMPEFSFIKSESSTPRKKSKSQGNDGSRFQDISVLIIQLKVGDTTGDSSRSPSPKVEVDPVDKEVGATTKSKQSLIIRNVPNDIIKRFLTMVNYMFVLLIDYDRTKHDPFFKEAEKEWNIALGMYANILSCQVNQKKKAIPKLSLRNLMLLKSLLEQDKSIGWGVGLPLLNIHVRIPAIGCDFTVDPVDKDTEFFEWVISSCIID